MYGLFSPGRCSRRLAPFASAHAAAGPPGSLAPFATPQLCFAQTPASGCTSAPGLESARAVTVSADGLNVYAGGGTSIAVFQRDAKTGTLTQARRCARLRLVLDRAAAATRSG